ncbi:hypothetical protein [Oculatella sp. LEGE 06141]|nr:hypothetical protein [Oculatella sp. LEGE 06141]
MAWTKFCDSAGRPSPSRLLTISALAAHCWFINPVSLAPEGKMVKKIA